MTNLVQTSNVRWYDGNAVGDGCGLGALSTSKVGFFGTTPVTRPAITAVTTGTATTTLNETRLDRMQAAFVTLGLISTDG